jgi:DNA-binding transcriptional regulator YdaS (Cro superfamily)
VPTVYTRTLKRAAELAGGEEPLARLLRVTPSHLVLWIRGALPPPGDIFLKAADIVAEHDLKQLSAQHAPTPQPKTA